MVGTGLDYSGISTKNCQSHYTFSPALDKVINSNSIVEWALQVCLENFQDIVASPRVKMYLYVNFDFSKSIIQFVSLYPSSTCGYFSYLKAYSLILYMWSITRSRAIP